MMLDVRNIHRRQLEYFHNALSTIANGTCSPVSYNIWSPPNSWTESEMSRLMAFDNNGGDSSSLFDKFEFAEERPPFQCVCMKHRQKYSHDLRVTHAVFAYLSKMGNVRSSYDSILREVIVGYEEYKKSLNEADDKKT